MEIWMLIGGSVLALAQAFLLFILNGIRETQTKDREAAALALKEDRLHNANSVVRLEASIAEAREKMVPRDEFRAELQQFFAGQERREERAQVSREQMLQKMGEATAQVQLVSQRAEQMQKQAENMVTEVAEFTTALIEVKARLAGMPPMPPIPPGFPR